MWARYLGPRQTRRAGLTFDNPYISYVYIYNLLQAVNSGVGVSRIILNVPLSRTPRYTRRITVLTASSSLITPPSSILLLLLSSSSQWFSGFINTPYTYTQALRSPTMYNIISNVYAIRRQFTCLVVKICDGGVVVGGGGDDDAGQSMRES